jgi:REP element-mobilizing transposase RayT
VADTFAWVLMPNHFHFLIRLKEVSEVSLHLTGFENLSGVKVKPPHQHFSNLFNAYTKAFNKRTGRHGSLFERPFKRKIIENELYLKQVILYIHNNPVHHGFCTHPMEYPWSSYLTCISIKPTKLNRDKVIGWFDNQANFKFVHEQKVQVERIENWLEI